MQAKSTMSKRLDPTSSVPIAPPSSSPPEAAPGSGPSSLKRFAVHPKSKRGLRMFASVGGIMAIFAVLNNTSSVSTGGGGGSGVGIGGIVGGGLRRIASGSSPSKINPKFGGAVHPGYFRVEDSRVSTNAYRFAAVSDLDQLSSIDGSGRSEFRSIVVPGTLLRNPETNRYEIDLNVPTRTLTSKHNEGGRGMELSELIVYQDRLLAFEDRTGIVYELLNRRDGQESYVVPRFVVTAGEGDMDKGMKWEWAAVKDGVLHMGSMGKEFSRDDGTKGDDNALWIATLNDRGEVRRYDWSEQYEFVRKVLGAEHPGYVVHEAILWSDVLKRWVFLPRRVSKDPYDENLDERKGSNKLVLVDEKFTEGTVVDIRLKDSDMDPLHGFSTFAFVPDTNDRHALAIRTVEEDCVGGDESVCKQRSYFVVFDVLSGEVLMDEVRVDGAVKLEGVEFVDVFAKEPTASGAVESEQISV